MKATTTSNTISNSKVTTETHRERIKRAANFQADRKALANRLADEAAETRRSR